MPAKLDPATIIGFTSDVDKAYAAGFFDGEGHCNNMMQSTQTSSKLFCRLGVSIGQNDRRVLEWFQSFWEGNIYKYQGKEQYQWTITGTRARVFLNQILPFVKVKAEQIQETLTANVEKRPSAKRRG